MDEGTSYEQYLVFVQGEIVRLRKLADKAPNPTVRDGISRTLLELLSVENYVLQLVLHNRDIEDEMHVQEGNDA